MKANREKTIKRGFTLMLTLMTLVLLASLIVQFQAETTTHVRTASYRWEKLQCRYAAESAMVIASQMIKEKLREGMTQPDSAKANELEGLQAALGLGEPNDMMSDMDEPNEFEEFADLDYEQYNLQDEIPFLLTQDTLDVGEAEVEIEIHDENGKYPLLWLMHSPINGKRTHTQKSVRKLADLFGADGATISKAIDLALNIGRNLEIPDLDMTLRKSTTGRRKQKRSDTWRPRGKKLSDKMRQTREIRRFEGMAAFACEWQRELSENEDYEDLKLSLLDHKGGFSDYLGSWGHTQININTAPVEVLEAAFGPLGMTAQMAQAIDDYRQANPFRSTGNLSKVEGLDRGMLRGVKLLTTAKSNTFSVQVSARLGRAHYELTGSFYRNKKGRLVNQAIYPGD